MHRLKPNCARRRGEAGCTARPRLVDGTTRLYIYMRSECKVNKPTDYRLSQLSQPGSDREAIRFRGQDFVGYRAAHENEEPSTDRLNVDRAASAPLVVIGPGEPQAACTRLAPCRVAIENARDLALVARGSSDCIRVSVPPIARMAGLGEARKLELKPSVDAVHEQAKVRCERIKPRQQPLRKV